jgi:hypothetical protein
MQSGRWNWFFKDASWNSRSLFTAFSCSNAEGFKTGGGRLIFIILYYKCCC